MKRLLLTLCILASLYANAAELIDGIYYNLHSDQEYYTAEVISGSIPYSEDIVIPSTVEFQGQIYPVRFIVGGAFKDCTELTSVNIPNSVTYIGDQTFENCPRLTSVNIPNSVRTIGGRAFANCLSLKSVNIPDGVTSIGNYTFENCTSLTSVNIPNSVTSIGDRAFANCLSLKSVNIPDGVTYIGNHTFENCTSLTSVNIPNSVTFIGVGAFRYCTNLISVNIPNSVTSIGYYTFENCTRLTSVNIPNSVTSIGTDAFAYCNQLKKVEFSSLESLLKISFESYYANPLYYAKHLYINGEEVTNITIPEDITSIGNNTFAGATCNITITGSPFIGYSFSGATCNIIITGNPTFHYNSFINFKGTVSAPSSLRTKMTNAGLSSISFYASDVNYLSGLRTPLLKGFIYDDPYFETVLNRKNLEFYDAEGKLLSCTKTDDRKYVVKGLKLNKLQTITAKYTDASGANQSYTFDVKTKSPIVTVSYESTQSTITVNSVEVETDESCSLTDSGLQYNNQSLNFPYIFKGLYPSEYIAVTPHATLDDEYFLVNKYYIYASNIELHISSKSTITSLEVKGSYTTGDARISDEKITFNGKTYAGNSTLISGLEPNSRYTVSYSLKANGHLFETKNTFSTAAFILDISSESTPTTLSIKGTHSKVDATISDEKITIDGKIYEGNNMLVSGLEPNTSYSITYSLKANDYQLTTTKTFSTAAIEMKTAAPKIITEGNAIIAAQTNISDVEKNVGFEWRRTDWTDDFASNTANAYLYKGQMEGYIRNINSSKLWKYRPYYLSDSGKYYYGDWMGFDPSNTSYFEPTVHTYDEIQIEGNTALVKGYALRGTDNIKVQGFVYWKKANATRAKGFNGDTQIEAVPADAMRVEATGQIMTATLTGLDYSTEYCYMAFATTIEGETFYGEEMSFKTAEGKVCAAPTIDFADGVITCTSETAGAECHYTYSIIGEGMNNGTVNSKKIEISAIAKAEGYTDSEKVTKTFDYTTSIRGDVDGDGIVTMKDANAVVNIYLRK